MANDAIVTRETSLVTWDEIRADVLKVNKELGKYIDAISPGKEYKFVKASYLYGDSFVNNGSLFLPINNTLTPISDPLIDKAIQQEISYSTLPLTLILKNDSELFLTAGKRIVPINLFHQGNLTGTYETMDYMAGKRSNLIWNICAGSRSIFMTPKITDKVGLKKLRNIYNIPSTTRIEKLSDHWKIFRTIAQSESFDQPWQNTVLFFGKKWFNNHRSVEWINFKDYLYRIIWEQANWAIDKVRFNMSWESFARIISSRRLQPKPYLIDHVKHLISISRGDFPAFSVMDDSQKSAPTSSLQKVFTEQYGLKQYLPTLMHASSLQDPITKPRYVYYSLSIPTILEGTPFKKTTSTVINDLREIKLLIETLEKNHHKFNLDAETTKTIQRLNIEFFHYEADAYNQVKLSSNIPNEDNTFVKDQKLFPDRAFCPTSPFFSGCIRLDRKNI